MEEYALHGVRPSSIPELYDLLGGRDKLEGLSTADVCNKLVKPMTENLSCSFCDLLKASNHAAYGENAEVFVIHIWGSKFLDVMDVLQQHFQHRPEVVIWIDIFCINQHRYAKIDQNLLDAIRNLIARIGYSVVTFDPWRDHAPLTRTWCLFELYSTAQANGTLEVALNAEQRESFVANIANNYNSIQNLDFKSSQALNEEDRQQILDYIERSQGGSSQLELVVSEKFRELILESMRLLIKQSPENINLRLALSLVYSRQNQLDRAAEVLEEYLRVRKQSTRATHPDLVACINDLASIYLKQGKASRAQESWEGILNLLQAALDPDHSSVLVAMNNLGNLYLSENKLQEARQMHESCLVKRQEILGDSHVDTLDSMHNLALVYDKLTDYERAQSLLEECLMHRIEVLGDSHIDTLETKNNLAVVLANQGEFERAQAIHEENLNIQRTKLGPNHHNTLSTMNNLANVLMNKGELNQARDMHQECLTIRQAVLGNEHVDTITSQLNLDLVNHKIEEKRKISQRSASNTECFCIIS